LSGTNPSDEAMTKMHQINEEDDLANISEALLDKSSSDHQLNLNTPNPLLISQNSDAPLRAE
jgi:hypothetical protein